MKQPLVLYFSSSDFKIYDVANKKVYVEKNYIANKLKYDYSNIKIISKNVLAIGNQAYEYYDKNPYDIEVIACMKDGKIVDIKSQATLISKIKEKYKLKFSYTSNNVYILTSKFLTNFELDMQKRASTIKKINKIYIEDIIANYFSVNNKKNGVVIYFGTENSFILILNNSQIISMYKIEYTEYNIDKLLQRHIKLKTNATISFKLAGFIRASFYNTINPKEFIDIPAINDKTGLPTKFKITNELIQKICRKNIKKLLMDIKYALKKLPPDVLAHCLDTEIILLGDLAKDRNLSKYLEKEFLVDCKKVEFDDVMLNSKLLSD